MDAVYVIDVDHDDAVLVRKDQILAIGAHGSSSSKVMLLHGEAFTARGTVQELADLFGLRAVNLNPHITRVLPDFP